MKKLAIALAFLTVLSSPVAAQDFQKGFVAYNAGDFATALKEWKPLAEQGRVSAQIYLGYLYDGGLGVPQDYKEAVKWYLLAAEQGDASAQFNLCGMSASGQGVPQDHKEVLKWCLLAAEQGHAIAQSNLGALHINGRGVLQDNVMAHMWYNIAAANGYSKSGEWRNEVAGRMTQSDIYKAQAMARECMNSGYKKCGY